MSLLARRSMMFLKKPSAELIHKYGYTPEAVGSYTALKDLIGNCHAYSGSDWGSGTNYYTASSARKALSPSLSDWGIQSGDDFSVVIEGYVTSAQYYEQTGICGFSSGLGQNLKTYYKDGEASSAGAFSIGTTANGSRWKGNVSVGYWNGSNRIVSSASSVIASGVKINLSLTYSAQTKNMVVYADGVEVMNETLPIDLNAPAFNVKIRGETSYDYVYIYKGVTDEVNPVGGAA